MPAVTRPAWLATGAIVAALFADGGVLGVGLPAIAVVALAMTALGAVVVALRHGRLAVATLLFGLGSVSLRASLVLVAAGTAAGPPLPVGNGSWHGQVVDISAPSGMEQRALLRLSGDGPGSPGWLVYGWLPRHPALVPGDLVSLGGRLELPPSDAPGFSSFLASQGAVGTLTARTLALVGRDSGPRAVVERVRWGIDAALSRALPEPEAGLAAGILVGLRERVSRAVADDFTVTGLTHVVAISGWNIALVAGIATGLLRATGLARRPRSLVVIAAIVGYTLLAGAEASVVRAAVMGGVIVLAREGGRASGAAAALALACWGLLVVDPEMIDDIGLQLSLAATAGLLAFGGRAESALRRLTRGRAPRWFCETMGVSLAAQLSTLPLILLHFGRLSLISPLANLLMAPLVPLAMLGAFAGVLVGPLLVAPVVSVVLAPLSLLAWLPLAAMVRGVGLMAEVPFANVGLSAPFSLVGAGLAVVAVVVALRPGARPSQGRRPDAPQPPNPEAARTRPARRGRRLAAAALSMVLAAAFLAVLAARPLARLQVSVLDIGQGDAILLETSDGRRLLVDGGPDPDLLVQRLDERVPVWDRHIDLVVLTHPHEDHAGGLAGLMPRYRVDRILETGMATQGSGVRELRAAAERLGVGRSRLVQGDAFGFGAASVTVLWPPLDRLPASAPSTGRGINDTSIVLGVVIGRQRVLLTGDLEEDRDGDLLEALGTDGLRWDVLKVAHHGSATASSRPLLGALRPRLAAISVGAGNEYGHPAPSLLQRLAEVGSTVWRTDLQGTLSVALEGRPETTAALLGRRPAGPCPAARPSTTPAQTDGRSDCYARPDGGPHTSRSALTAHVHGAIAPAAAARHGRGRGSVLPGPPRRALRGPRGPAPGGDSRAPPRRRQGTAAGSHRPGARARRRRGRLAQRSGASGAGADGRRAPRASSFRSRCRRLGRPGAPGGAHRQLCRQAGHATTRLAGAALRPLATQARRVRRSPLSVAGHGRASRIDPLRGYRHQT
jgi:competence protein ComEC